MTASPNSPGTTSPMPNGQSCSRDGQNQRITNQTATAEFTVIQEKPNSSVSGSLSRNHWPVKRKNTRANSQTSKPTIIPLTIDQSFSRLRAMITRMISFVPSRIWCTLRSRSRRSSG